MATWGKMKKLLLDLFSSCHRILSIWHLSLPPTHLIESGSDNWLKSGTCGKDHDFPLQWLHLAFSFTQCFSIRYSKQYSLSVLPVNIISSTCLLRTSFTLLLSDVSAILPRQTGEHVFHLTANSSALCYCSQLCALLLETPALKQWLLTSHPKQYPL